MKKMAKQSQFTTALIVLIPGRLREKLGPSRFRGEWPESSGRWSIVRPSCEVGPRSAGLGSALELPCGQPQAPRHLSPIMGYNEPHLLGSLSVPQDQAVLRDQ